MFGLDYYKKMFPVQEYPHVLVVGTEDEVDDNEEELSTTEVVIVVSTKRPSGRASFARGGQEFEARVVVAIDVPEKKNNDPHFADFDAVRFARHGGGFSEWWTQRRTAKSNDIMTKYKRRLIFADSRREDLFPGAIPKQYFRYVTVYANTRQIDVEKYKHDMHRSIGGQTRASCGCNEGNRYLLILSSAREEEKGVCSALGCRNKEKYTCPRSTCSSRLCGRRTAGEA